MARAVTISVPIVENRSFGNSIRVPPLRMQSNDRLDDAAPGRMMAARTR
jgi:hypothetical protein